MASARGIVRSPVPTLEGADTPHASRPSDLTPSPTSNKESDVPPRTTNSNGGYDQQHRFKDRPRGPSLSVRDRAYSTTSSSSSSSVRRKPLPATASPLATRFSSAEKLVEDLTAPAQPFARPYSNDSPTLYEFPPSLSNSFSAPAFSPRFSKISTPDNIPPPTAACSEVKQSTSDHTPRVIANEAPTDASYPILSIPTPPRPASATDVKHLDLNSESAAVSATESIVTWPANSSSTSLAGSTTVSIFSTKPTPPHELSTPNASANSHSEEPSNRNSNIPRSPARLGTFSGWGGTASPTSPNTTYSDKTYSPISSPLHAEFTRDLHESQTSPARDTPTALDISKANTEAGYCGAASPQLPLTTPELPPHFDVAEMETELTDITKELAASIGRELKLEVLVERLQAEAQNALVPNKRTSDYFSDSGISSVRYGDSEARAEELDRMLRRTEQDKAHLRRELTDKVQDERIERKRLQAQIRVLEEKVSHAELVAINSVDTSGRLKELEATCEDLRRRLTDERQAKVIFEDLLSALEADLQKTHNERDNLRDEIVPQLRARVEGLEAQASKHEQLSYEQTKMQQQLESLRAENVSLVNAQRQSVDVQQHVPKLNTTVEEITTSLSRSTSTKTTESREALLERVKEIEMQRDSLHRAVKNLLERQQHQNRESQKRIRQLEIGRDSPVKGSPKRPNYNKEVEILRLEINTLRRRADEAIEQKWQCEKGLSGLKMDLDRAEQEISSLRNLLQERDILIASESRSGTEGRPSSAQVSSDSLEQAYRELQNAYVESLDRVKNAELSALKDEETSNAMKRLEQRLSDAISEHHVTKQEVESLQLQNARLKESEKKQISEEEAVANELLESAQRVEGLAAQVRQQLDINSTLRSRLTETIERGDEEQRTNARKITLMQSKLKSLEDQLMAAQQASEETISRHEDEIRGLREMHNSQLQRTKEGFRSPRSFSPRSPLSPMFMNTNKKPRLSRTTSGNAMSISEDSQIEFLKGHVVHLEAALADADKEMEKVVGCMNIAQIEVMELQNEREEAVRETKRLQKVIEEERIKIVEQRFTGSKT